MTDDAAPGFPDMTPEDRQHFVDDVFHSVAGRYDLMNDLMSAGMHRLWKRALVNALNPPRAARTAGGKAWRLLDMAGGTGDIAFRVAERSGGHAAITVADINPSMLQVGRERAEKLRLGGIEFVEANAEVLPFEEASFDAYTIAFGIRNVPQMDVALREAHRVLKHGGRFLCLEFSAVDVPGLDRLYAAYSDHGIPALGRVVAGDAESYRYLVDSIRRFPNPERFAEIIRAAGFGRVTWQSFSGGIAVLHSAWKL